MMLFRDLIDLQNHVQERVRSIEINPGPVLAYHPTPWDPAYDELTLLDLVAYHLLHYASFHPRAPFGGLPLPAIPPEAQVMHDILTGDGYASYGGGYTPTVSVGNLFSRAFLRALVNAGGLVYPSGLEPEMTHRIEGFASDITGTNWRRSPNGRYIQWATMQAAATPPPGSQWGMTSPPYTYGAQYSGGHPYQTGSTGNAGFYFGEEVIPCDYNQYPSGEWSMTTDPANGVENLVQMYGPDGITLSVRCFRDNPPLNPSGDTETGAWILESAVLDASKGLYGSIPVYYTGQPFASYDRDPDGHLTEFPGYETWRDRINTHCFGDSDWTGMVQPWYQSRRPGTAATPGPSRHWQRAPLYLTWTGQLEYRVWQRVLYLRGTVTNPFLWLQSFYLMPMPPGVVPVNHAARTLARAIDFDGTNVPTAVHYDPVEHRLEVNPDQFGSTDSPAALCLDGVRIPLERNPPYVT